jgi:iron complex outermembrane receptor protein
LQLAFLTIVGFDRRSQPHGGDVESPTNTTRSNTPSFAAATARPKTVRAHDPLILLFTGVWFVTGAVSAANAGTESTSQSGSVEKVSVTVEARDDFDKGVSGVQAPSSPDEDSQTEKLEEIVVTARKVTERLQDVPMSVAVVNAQTLERTGAIDLVDLGRQVAGLTVVSAAPGQNVITVRGLSGNNTVGLYIDDTPVTVGIGNAVQPTNFDMDPALFDLSRVEVLRGPQGTLYGAGSFGGTVRYITNQPDLSETQLSAKTTFSATEGGGFNQEVDGLVNQPLIPGYLAVRAMAYERDYDGYLDRYPTDPLNYLAVQSGPLVHDINTERTYGGRVVLEAKPVDEFSATLSAYYQNMYLGAPFTFDSPPGTFDDPIQSRLVNEPSTDRFTLATLTLQGDIEAVHLISSTSYTDRQVYNTEDDSKALYYFFSPIGQVYPSPLYSGAGNHNFIQENRVTGTFGRVHAMIGLFYAHAVAFGVLNWPTPTQYVPIFGNESTYFNWNDFLDIQKALFGELDIDLLPGLQATVGAREYHQSQRYTFYINGVFNGGVETPQTTRTSDAQGTTPKYGLSYHVSPDVSTYATAAEGYREGGPLYPFPSTCAQDLANLGLSTAPSAFKPDTIWNYELGAKTQWFDHRLTVNGDVYYIDWKNIQQNITLPTCGFGFTGNFGTASSEGSELEASYAGANVKLSLAAAYNEAKLTSTVPGAAGQVGQTLEYAPRWAGSASAEYHRPLSAGTSGYVRADFSSTTHVNANYNIQSIYYDVGGYSLLNLRVGFTHNSWTGSLFINNALDKHAETDLPLANGIDLPTQRRIAMNRPRTIGIDMRFDR